MRFWNRINTIGLAGVASVLASPRPCSAIEPEDGSAPWSYGADATSTFIVAPHVTAKTWTDVETIYASGEQDYLLAVCGPGYVQGVRIDFRHALGDLDLFAYSGTGTVLGISNGTGDSEYVSLGNSFAQQAVVMRVYGYDGATGTYSVTVSCSP